MMGGMRGWCVIHEDDLLALLRQVENGDSPDVVFAEFYANSTHEFVIGDDA